MNESDFEDWCQGHEHGEWHNDRGQFYCEVGRALGIEIDDGNLKTRRDLRSHFNKGRWSGVRVGIDVDKPLDDFEPDGDKLVSEDGVVVGVTDTVN